MRIIVTSKEKETTDAAFNAAKLLVDSVKIEGDFIFDKESAVRKLAPILEKATIVFFNEEIERTRANDIFKNVFGGTDDLFEKY